MLDKDREGVPDDRPDAPEGSLPQGPLLIFRPQKIYQSLSNLPEKASREAATQRGMEELYQK